MITDLSTLILQEAAHLNRGEHLSASEILKKASVIESLGSNAEAEISEEINRLRLFGYVTGTRPLHSENGTLIIGLTGITHEGREYLNRMRS